MADFLLIDCNIHVFIVNLQVSTEIHRIVLVFLKKFPDFLQVDRSKSQGGGGELPFESDGMLVISFRGVNYGFWYHLECSGRNADIFRVSFRVAREEI